MKEKYNCLFFGFFFDYLLKIKEEHPNLILFCKGYKIKGVIIDSKDMSKIASSAMSAALSALGNMSESERSTTQSAISSNINVQITDSEAQQAKTGKTAEETLQSLNRDTQNANQVLAKQDLAKAQERQEMAQVIGELAQAGIKHATEKQLKEADDKQAEAEKLANTNPAQAEALRNEAKAIEAEYGVGSPLQMGIRAVTAALQGLATGSVENAAVGALSPYANKLIKEYTTNPDQSVNTEANLIAHAVLGAIEAHVTGNNATAGAVGALTAEAAAPYIMQALYGTDKATDLNDSQKQNIANLSQIAAGLSGGLVGDSTASGIAGAEIGKRAVENNNFGLNPSAELVTSLAIASEAEAKEAELREQALKEFEKEHPNIVASVKAGITLGEFAADFTPVIGDIKGIVEAETAGDYFFAILAVVPATGDGAKKAYAFYKSAKAAGNVADMKRAMNEAVQFLPKESLSIAVKPIGSRYNQMNQPKNPNYQPVRNNLTSIGGRNYSGHALDRMQDRGIMPSVVENAIKTGIKKESRNNTFEYIDVSNGVKVILNSKGDVVTVTYGK